MPRVEISNGKQVTYPAEVFIPETTSQLVEFALDDAILRSQKDPDAIARINNGITNRFFPFVDESWIIASQLEDPVYGSFVTDTVNYLDSRVGCIVCPDGRVAFMSLGPAGVMNNHRRLMGMPLTRPSTRDRIPVLDDDYLAASITNTITERKRAGKNPAINEFLGPHIFSMVPIDGCGARFQIVTAKGHVPEIGMRFGGIEEFFTQLGEAFYAFDNIAQRAGGDGTTIDMVHDIYTEGLIYGLRDQYKNFKPELSLRANLLALQQERKILMTEFLDPRFKQVILDRATSRGSQLPLNVRDPHNFAKNNMLIGEITLELCQQEEKESFPSIPDCIKMGKSETSIRVLGYQAIWNVAYRTLARRIAGQHDLIGHEEDVVSSGPTSAIFNRRNIPFVQKNTPGPFKERDIIDTVSLYNMAGGFMGKRGIDLTKEARIVIITGEYDRSLYANDTKAESQLNYIASTVRNNAAAVREVLLESVYMGEAVVLGALHDPETRKLVAVV